MARFLLTGKYAGQTIAYGSFMFRDGVCTIPDNRTDLLTAMMSMYVRYHGVIRDPDEVVERESIDVARERRRQQLEAMPLNEARGVARPYNVMAANMKKAQVIEVVLAREFPHISTKDLDASKEDPESGSGGSGETGAATAPGVVMVAPADGLAADPSRAPKRVGDASIAPAPPNP